MQLKIFVNTLAVLLLAPTSSLYSGQITSKIKENPDSAVAVGTLVALSSFTTAGIVLLYKNFFFNFLYVL
jgi:hypothetical protein